MNKSFSPGFQLDIADLLDICIENQTDSITVTMNYGERDLEIDMTFREVPCQEAEDGECK